MPTAMIASLLLILPLLQATSVDDTCEFVWNIPERICSLIFFVFFQSCIIFLQLLHASIALLVDPSITILQLPSSHERRQFSAWENAWLLPGTRTWVAIILETGINSQLGNFSEGYCVLFLSQCVVSACRLSFFHFRAVHEKVSTLRSRWISIARSRLPGQWYRSIREDKHPWIVWRYAFLPLFFILSDGVRDA